MAWVGLFVSDYSEFVVYYIIVAIIICLSAFQIQCYYSLN